MVESTAPFPMRPAFKPAVKLMKCNGHGGCPSSKSKAKVPQKIQPTKVDIFAAAPVETTLFYTIYSRGDIPAVVNFSGATRSVEWK